MNKNNRKESLASASNLVATAAVMERRHSDTASGRVRSKGSLASTRKPMATTPAEEPEGGDDIPDNAESNAEERSGHRRKSMRRRRGGRATKSKAASQRHRKKKPAGRKSSRARGKKSGRRMRHY